MGLAVCEYNFKPFLPPCLLPINFGDILGQETPISITIHYPALKYNIDFNTSPSK